jgi:oxygen-independent coproporphyrinogen-3 oxidase
MRLGVLQGHGEAIAPGEPGFATFLRLLEREGAEVLALGDADAHAGLIGWDAILIGGPTRLLPDRTRAALRFWVLAGGRLLVTSGAGGDHPPLAASGHPLAAKGGGTKLSSLIEGLGFRDDVIHWSSSMEAGENLIVPLDLSELGPNFRGQTLDFIAGCSLVLGPEARVIEALAARGSEGVEPWSFPDPVLEYDDLLTAEGGEITPVAGPVFAELEAGFGRVFAAGSTHFLHDGALARKRHGERETGTRAFVDRLIGRWLHGSAAGELARRMKGPQRHRLLQGYPMPKLMEESSEQAAEARRPSVPRRLLDPAEKADWFDELTPGQHRAALVGVLPHPFCNPTVRGCGFCTFPQEKLAREKMPALVAAVCRDIAAFRGQQQGARPAVPALYFGGATANLTPAAGFEALGRELALTFDTSGAEITLEGVPRYFAIDDFRLMRSIGERFPGATTRISMGVQTFDRAQIERMGRAGFGDRGEIERLVGDAHRMGFGVSCDLLINLPGQTLPQMIEDLTIAAGAGFDQICLYHLVLFEGLGTPWSEDRSLLSLLRGNEENFANQRLCRKRLHELGFTQTTLTNFERRAGDRPRFRYEPLGFQPDRHDLVGFGPAAISLAASPDFRRGWKVVRDQDSARFLGGVQRRFLFDEIDMKLLFLTRSLARLAVDTARYEALFGTPVQADFPREIDALLARGLLRERPAALALSPEGMFFADAVAGLLAWRRVQVLRDAIDDPRSPPDRPPPAPHLRFHDPNISDYGSMG